MKHIGKVAEVSEDAGISWDLRRDFHVKIFTKMCQAAGAAHRPTARMQNPGGRRSPQSEGQWRQRNTSNERMKCPWNIMKLLNWTTKKPRQISGNSLSSEDWFSNASEWHCGMQIHSRLEAKTKRSTWIILDVHLLLLVNYLYVFIEFNL